MEVHNEWEGTKRPNGAPTHDSQSTRLQIYHYGTGLIEQTFLMKGEIGERKNEKSITE